MPVLEWLRRRDAGLWALRRAGRTAIVMPSLFFVGSQLLHNPALATFAAFGSFALLLLVDLDGPRRQRLIGILGLAAAGALFVVLGTLVSQTPWLAALTMAVVAFVVLFAGVVSSVLASASTTLLLAFVLPVATPGSVSTIPDRLAGWGLAAGVAALAVTVLWPAPPRDPLRPRVIECCRLLAASLQSRVDHGSGGLTDQDQRDAAATADAATTAVTALQSTFYASPNRPTGLGTASRTLVRLVDELGWLSSVLAVTPQHPQHTPVPASVLAVQGACAAVLSRGADLLDRAEQDLGAIRAARTELRRLVAELEASATDELPVRRVQHEGLDREFVDSLEPTFRAQELAFAVDAVGLNIERTSAAENRTFTARLLGRQPEGVASPWSAARERALAHLEPHSVWLHNSLRGAVGLGLAVLVADLTGVQHSFWVVLGTLSVLRSNALSTGQNVIRGLLGTVAGIVLGGLIVSLIGTDRTVLWVLLPVCILVAGLAPAAISFAAGQAAFTLTLVILFNIIEPVGYLVGIIRIEDIAIGCAVSLVVGVLFWPRGAGSALGIALDEAYVASARYLRSTVAYGVAQCHRAACPDRPESEATAAAAASRRLDDAFREYLTERGGKRLNLSEVTTLVTGVIAPRLAGDALLDLWERELGSPAGDRTAAGAELTAEATQLADWYEAFGAGLAGAPTIPEPSHRDADTDERLIAAVRRDLADSDGMTTPTAVRMIWTGDHLDAVRRLQRTLTPPARLLASRDGRRPAASVGRR